VHVEVKPFGSTRAHLGPNQDPLGTPGTSYAGSGPIEAYWSSLIFLRLWDIRPTNVGAGEIRHEIVTGSFLVHWTTCIPIRFAEASFGGNSGAKTRQEGLMNTRWSYLTRA